MLPIHRASAVANSDIANVSQAEKELTMNAIATTNTDLHWNVLTIKRPGLVRDFNRLNEATVNARELYDAMLELYPDRVNPGSLWGAANTAKKQA
jgi:hypothetical protein